MNKELYFRNKKNNSLPDGQLSGFAQRLKQLRNECGISQESLSKKIGLSKSTYGTYEIDKALPDAETVRNLAEYYQVSTDYLLGITDTKRAKAENKLENNFSAKCNKNFRNIQYDEKLKSTFEILVSNKNFLRFLHFFAAYLHFYEEPEWVKLNLPSDELIEQFKMDEDFEEYLSLSKLSYKKMISSLKNILGDLQKQIEKKKWGHYYE